MKLSWVATTVVFSGCGNAWLMLIALYRPRLLGVTHDQRDPRLDVERVGADLAELVRARRDVVRVGRRQHGEVDRLERRLEERVADPPGRGEKAVGALEVVEAPGRSASGC